MSEQQPDLKLFLDRLTSRTALCKEEREAILKLPSHAAHVRQNSDFVGLGERVDHACFVLVGLVGRFDQNIRGNRQITSLHIAGDMPDLHSVVQPQASSALQALAHSIILRVPHTALRDAMFRYPAIGEAFWRECTVDASITTQWVVNVGRREAKARIAHLFCEMGWRYRVDRTGKSMSYRLDMTQAHLADATGLSAVHVNRSLMALRAEGITFKDGEVRVSDWQRLAEIGEFEPNYLMLGEPSEMQR